MYEYSTVPRSRYGAHYYSLDEFLNELGREGWELVAIDYGCFIFKRAIKEG